MDEGLYREADGVRTLGYFSDDAIRSAMSYKPRQGDTVLVTYPKCGTNWTLFIIWNILTRGRQPSDVGEFAVMCPFIELIGADAAENTDRRGPIVTHLPLSAFRPVDWAKYIYVARNPYDCAVSCYHFLKGVTPKTCTDVSFDKFLALFLSGKVPYGDYFDHLLPWYERRDDSNVLFLTYEQLKADARRMALKIAQFLGAEHCTVLQNDSDLLQSVLDNSSLETMAAFLKDNVGDRVKKMIKAASQTSSETVEELKNSYGETW
ncbi:sulfotransferase ssu-1-like [Dermacentor andersoni]|uniref:sulfotransferase ssu-1-like n=1 Tax=Dermacentor andersoni TaxID=34620 RepID=UPI003B3AA90E